VADLQHYLIEFLLINGCNNHKKARPLQLSAEAGPYYF